MLPVAEDTLSKYTWEHVEVRTIDVARLVNKKQLKAALRAHCQFATVLLQLPETLCNVDDSGIAEVGFPVAIGYAHTLEVTVFTRMTFCRISPF